MRYVMSDIHGCYDQYIELLQKINCSEKDTLYILGDAMDRGPESIKVIQDIMQRANVKFFVGNHDYYVVSLAKKILDDTRNNRKETTLSSEEWMDYRLWMKDGGEITFAQLEQLSVEEQEAIFAFIENASVYDLIEVEGKKYILSHAGIGAFSEGKGLEEYDFFDFIESRMNYDKRYYSDDNIFIISGHTPTPFIRTDHKPLVYQGNGHIAIDCGCAYGGQLAAYCIETGEAVYVDGRTKTRRE